MNTLTVESFWMLLDQNIIVSSEKQIKIAAGGLIALYHSNNYSLDLLRHFDWHY